MTDLHSSLLLERFEILERLGAGGQAQTFLARDHQSGESVALKELSLGKATDWKAIELFEREAAILRSLDHPRIPRYVHSFHLQEEGRFFIAQEFIAGKTLDALLEEGLRFNQTEALSFLEEMLGILAGIHSLSPPVIHRDIKPANIIAADSGSYVLIDFGAVQDVVARTVGGSTIVGTTGFMPPEQLLGRTGPGADLYSLAATVVQMVSGVDPSELPMQRMKLQFRDRTPLSPPFLELLEKMLEPEIEDRLSSVDQVLPLLEDFKSRLSRGILPAAAAQTDDGQGEKEQNQTRELIAHSPRCAQKSLVSLAGDSLRIEITEANAKKARPFSLALFLVASLLGALLALRLRSFVFLAFSLGGLYFFVNELRDSKPSATHSIRLTPKELRLTKTIRSSGKETFLRDLRLPLDKLLRVHGNLSKNIQNPGIAFLDADGHRHIFPAGPFLQKSENDQEAFRELEWIQKVIESHLSSLRSNSRQP